MAEGDIVRQAIEGLPTSLGPGDPDEISWVAGQLRAFRDYLEREWAKGPSLDRIYAVNLYDANARSRDQQRQRRATPEGRAKSAEQSRRSRAGKKARTTGQ